MRFPVALGRRTALAALAAALAAILATMLATQLGGPSRATAADHLDAPGLTPPGGDKRADITDIYAFASPANANRTVLVVNVNPATAGGVPAYFGRGVPGVAADKRIAYWLNVDTTGDAVADVRYRLVFGKPKNGVQSFELRRNGRVVVPMGVGRTTRYGASPRITTVGGTKVFAGVADDPFFFDLNGFLNLTAPLPGNPADDSLSFVGCSSPRTDFFAGLNVSSIVLEVPNARLGGSGTIGFWATTTIAGEQNDRMGRPAIATVFIPSNPLEPNEPSQKSAYNHAQPKDDQANFRAEVEDSLAVLFSLNDAGGILGGSDDPSDDAAAIDGLADVLLPDVLTFELGNGAGFLNGRMLDDDVIDAELGLVTEGTVTTDCVDANDVAFRASFPYVAAAH